MVSNKFLAILLLTYLACSSNGHRVKRTFSFLFPSSEPKKTYPIYKVHRYTGIHIVPVRESHGNQEHAGEAPSIVDIPGDDDGGYGDSPSGSGLGVLSSLLPLGTGLVTSALGVSTGSAGNNNNFDERIGLAAKKDLLNSITSTKKRIISSAVTGTLNAVVNKGLKVKGLVKGVFKGPKTTIATNSVYKLVPLEYPRPHSFWSKVPIIGHFFHTEIPLDIPNVGLPHLPQLVSVDGPPDLPLINIAGHYNLPYKTGAYVKVKIPHNRYEIPSTSYGVPGDPVAVPEPPQDTDEDEDFGYTAIPEAPEEPVTTEAPPPESYPYPPSKPEYVPPPPQYIPATSTEYVPPPPELPLEPAPPVFKPYPPATNPFETFPYPAETFPYPPSGYYQQASASEHHAVTVEPERPIYRHKLDFEIREDHDESENDERKEEPQVEVIPAVEETSTQKSK